MSLQQTLEVLESTGRLLHHCWCAVRMNDYSFDLLNKQMDIVDAEIIVLREQLAKPDPEPVAEIVSGAGGCLSTQWSDAWTPNEGDKLYTSAIQPLKDNHPLMVFAKECMIGAYQEKELADAAGCAIEVTQNIKE